MDTPSQPTSQIPPPHPPIDPPTLPEAMPAVRTTYDRANPVLMAVGAALAALEAFGVMPSPTVTIIVWAVVAGGALVLAYVAHRKGSSREEEILAWIWGAVQQAFDKGLYQEPPRRTGEIEAATPRVGPPSAPKAKI